MMEIDREATGEATIDNVFHLYNRGLVLVLGKDFFGTIKRGGTVSSKRGISHFIGPEVASGSDKSRLCVIATDINADNMFSIGDIVKFYAP
jgi:hypothetical protein